MRINSSTRFAAMAVLFGAMACAGNKARTDTDETAAARDTTSTDSVGAQQNPPGYRGMERDTTIAPPAQQQPSDTFLQNQGTGTPQDTSGYSGAERVDTTGQANPQARTDSTSMRTDSTSMADSSWSKSGDTTGYHPSDHQPSDTTARQ
ncbi:MAG: hypothetical protein ABI785_10740 [Gemmatimonadales bacterium]